jgi:hypothetical protein
MSENGATRAPAPRILVAHRTGATIMPFRVRGLSPGQFRPLFSSSDDELKAQGIVRVVADSHGYPCRASLAEAAPGDELLLLNYEHLPANNPYRSRHAIYVARGSSKTFDEVDVVPEVILHRLVSVRAFDANDMIVDADVVDGKDAAPLFEKLLANSDVRYLHVHNAKRGCYSARVERA